MAQGSQLARALILPVLPFGTYVLEASAARVVARVRILRWIGALALVGVLAHVALALVRLAAARLGERKRGFACFVLRPPVRIASALLQASAGVLKVADRLTFALPRVAPRSEPLPQ